MPRVRVETMPIAAARPVLSSDGDRHRGEPGHAVTADRDAGEVGARAEEGGLAERQQPGVAEQQIVAHHDDAVDQDVDGQRLRRQQPGQHGQHRDRQQHALRREAGRARWTTVWRPLRRSMVSVTRSSLCMPNRPCGRISSTTAISANMTMVAISGANSATRLMEMPTMRPATTAPTIEPRPPITVTTKASASTSEPISGLTLTHRTREHAAERGKPDAEPEDREPDPADVDAEHLHDGGIAGARAHDQADPRLLQRQPEHQQHHRHQRDDEQAVAREEADAEIEHADQLRRGRKRNAVAAEHDPHALDQDVAEAEGEQQRIVDRASIEPADQDELDQHAEARRSGWARAAIPTRSCR